ncbi:homoprotocatechuate degradation operon regulator HpaR [Neisseria shayeganii]|nr:homoprotocatechuate degradation operon regulator HpaR [Neisseria shayeganii]QMT41691.1 homoprotocatechuate degradation operon regulator HpaR [Neisseria shayeganii]
MIHPSKHMSLNIALIQAREALMTHFRPLLNEVGLTDQQWRILRLLAENGTMDFQDLARTACILRPSLTGILTRLEKMDLVMRLKPASDQRRVFLKLTSLGERTYTDFVNQIDKHYDIIETLMPKDKIDQLHTLLAELATIGVEDDKKYAAVAKS